MLHVGGLLDEVTVQLRFRPDRADFYCALGRPIRTVRFALLAIRLGLFTTRN